MKSLREKLEVALVDLLSATIEETVVPSIASGKLEFPYVICEYGGGEEINAQTGHTRATVNIRVVSVVDPEVNSSGAADHNALFGKVIDACEVDALAELITQAGEDLLVVGIEGTTEEEPDIEQREDVDIFTSNYSIRLLAGHR